MSETEPAQDIDENTETANIVEKSHSPHTNHEPLEEPRVGRDGPGRSAHFIRVGVLGVIAGLVAVAFQWCLHESEIWRTELLAWLHTGGRSEWGWMVLPIVGLMVGSIVGVMVRKIEPDSSGSGIPHIKGSLLELREIRWKRLLPVKFIGGVLGVGLGLSLGREGPTVQLGAAAGRAMGDLLKLKPRVTGQLVSCGAGAGLAAAFNAPLAGFIFVIEELRREMSPITYAGALLAAVCADIVARFLTGSLPSFHIVDRALQESMTPLPAIPAVAILGILGGASGVLFNKGLMRTSRLAREATTRFPRLPAWAITGLVGMVVGLAGWWIPEALGGGHPVANDLLNGNFATHALWWIGVLLVAKLLLTWVSYASGAPGGIFAPMLLMGALMGFLFGEGFRLLFPSLDLDPRIMAVLGMAAWFTGSVRAPLTGIVLILEMTGNYNQLLPIAIACLASYMTAERLKDEPIYEALLDEDLRHRGLGEVHAEPVPVVMGVQHGSLLDGTLLRDAKFPGGCNVVHIERRGKEIVAIGSTRVMAGDHVTVLTPGDTPESALKVVDMCRAH